MLWYQKSREKWVKLGDRNTSFFHAQTIVRRRRNRVEGAFIDGDIWCTDGEILKHEANKFFQNIYVQPRTNYALTDYGQLPFSLDLASKHALLEPVSKEEVWNALKFMKPFKAPGPDGFQPFFFKKYWHLVGNDVWKLV